MAKNRSSRIIGQKSGDMDRGSKTGKLSVTVEEAKGVIRGTNITFFKFQGGGMFRYLLIHPKRRIPRDGDIPPDKILNNMLQLLERMGIPAAGTFNLDDGEGWEFVELKKGSAKELQFLEELPDTYNLNNREGYLLFMDRPRIVIDSVLSPVEKMKEIMGWLREKGMNVAGMFVNDVGDVKVYEFRRRE